MTARRSRSTFRSPDECVLDDGPLAWSGVVHLVDGQPEVSFVRPSHTVMEGDYAQFEVALSEPSGVVVEVTYRTFPGTAYSSGDFWASTGVVQFAPGKTRSWTPSIRVRTDQIVEDEEFFSVELSQPVYALLGAQSTTEVRIVDRDTYQAFALDAVHVEHDLVHLTWRQTPYIHGDSATPTGWELLRRDADAGGAWQLIAEATSYQLPTMWRDFLVPGGVRSEYRVLPVYHPWTGDIVTGIATEWSMSAPPPSAEGEADNTVLPGFAVVSAGEEISPFANAFAGHHDYTFTLHPDPGPEFVEATVDVYVDDVLAVADEREISQPWDSPHNGVGRDDSAAIEEPGFRAVSGAQCNGPTCEVVVTGVATGTHTLRFVVSEGGGTSTRSIVQDLHPWWGQVGQFVTDYPTPILYLFSDRVATTSPVFWIGGPVMPFPLDSADHSDIVEMLRATLVVDGVSRNAGTFGSDGLVEWESPTPWVDGATHNIGAVSSDSDGRNVGRNILSRGLSGEHVDGRQILEAIDAPPYQYYDIDSAPFEFAVTVDTSLESNQAPTVTWVTPAAVSEDDDGELWTEIWLRVEDHDQDVNPHTVMVSNLSLVGGAETFQAHYADPAEQIRAEGAFGWFVCRIPLSISGTEFDNQLVIHAEDTAGHAVDESGFSIRRHLVEPGEYPVPVLSRPLVGRYYGDGETVLMDAAESTVPEGYEMWLGAMARDGSNAMPLAAVASGASGEFVTSWDYDEYVVRVVIATPEAMPSEAELRAIRPPCRIGDPDLTCASAELVVSKAAYPSHVPFKLDHVVPDQAMLQFGSAQPLVERSADGGATWQTVSSYEFWWQEYYLIDRDIEEGATYHYRIPLFEGALYLGQTTTGPGLPVEVPVWSAPRVVPELLDVTWACPQGASRFVCQGTLDLRLNPEPGETLEGTTVRVFLNEPTRQLTGRPGR